jgi:outer membrane lipoprotein-sorting protein
MRFLRTAPTGRLLAVIVTAVIVVAGGTAIAIAAAGSGPVPPRTSLAAALSRAMHTKAPDGISARVTFTNNLIGSGLLQGTDPLLSGASGRIWAHGDHLRIELQGENGDAQIVLDKGAFWIYDPTSNTVYTGSLPTTAGGAPGTASGGHANSGVSQSAAIPTVAEIQSFLTRIEGHARTSGAVPSDVGGAAAYSVRISPVRSAGLLSGARLAWDANRGVPLDIALYAKNVTGPVLELKVTDISYGPVAASDYMLPVPPGANVVKLNTQSAGGPAVGATPRSEVSGAAAVAARVPFTLDAPAALGGMARRTVRLEGHDGALLLYGHGLGGIAVIERSASASTAGGASAGGALGAGGLLANLMLPTVQVDGSVATELPTALGTVLQFTRGGVSYIVAGSVPTSVAVSAARGL